MEAKSHDTLKLNDLVISKCIQIVTASSNLVANKLAIEGGAQGYRREQDGTHRGAGVDSRDDDQNVRRGRV
jgi:hypothetical protein